ncbi:hypothetical protein [Flavobacterium sp.]|uniref:hypothetical protein n=1 Tax=Flavobacterium sp. TaxID=239 RepID=UPI00375228DA
MNKIHKIENKKYTSDEVIETFGKYLSIQNQEILINHLIYDDLKKYLEGFFEDENGILFFKMKNDDKPISVTKNT